MTQPMILTEATLQAILDLQEQSLIVGDPVVKVEQEGYFNEVTLNVQMPLPLFRLNKNLDLVYQTLEDTSTKTYRIVVEVTPYEPLGWDEA
ncbi:hypothetical protein [Deinococcus alpinitundrae]|uniref:hypothetical protein n=1 Tax=Deinococcus alpinitundrae TaxID=468913 RepID=UPI00137AAD23|nr:hypothetical protein [Deinococcus alpinitundrae]